MIFDFTLFLINLFMFVIAARAFKAILFEDSHEVADENAGWCIAFVVGAGLLAITIGFAYSVINLLT